MTYAFPKINVFKSFICPIFIENEVDAAEKKNLLANWLENNQVWNLIRNQTELLRSPELDFLFPNQFSQLPNKF